MQKLSIGIASLCLAGLFGCSDSATPKISAKYDVDGGFWLSTKAAKDFSSAHPGLLWVTGPNVSMPLETNARTLPTINPKTQAVLLYPDLMVPKTIPAGTELTIHVASLDDGTLSSEVGEVVIEASSETKVLYGGIGWTQGNCYEQCWHTGSCNWCDPCYAHGYSNCGNTLQGPWATSPQSWGPNTCHGTGVCNNGGTHACWGAYWVQACS
jgi:hypothetical protein